MVDVPCTKETHATRTRDLTDAQWAMLDSLILEPERRKESPWTSLEEPAICLERLFTSVAKRQSFTRYQPEPILSGGIL